MNGHPRVYEILKGIADLHERKNTDYAAGGKQGPLGNFKRCASIMALYPGMKWDTPFGVAMNFMLKQLDAALILASQERKSVTGEDIPDRLKDVAAYSVIAMVIAEEEKCAFDPDPRSERSHGSQSVPQSSVDEMLRNYALIRPPTSREPPKI